MGATIQPVLGYIAPSEVDAVSDGLSNVASTGSVAASDDMVTEPVFHVPNLFIAEDPNGMLVPAPITPTSSDFMSYRFC